MAGTLTPSWFLYFTDSVGAAVSQGREGGQTQGAGGR